MLGRLYRILWRLFTRFLRHAVRRPVQAVIELILGAVLGRALLTAAQNAVREWIAVHHRDLMAAGWIVAALGAVGIAGVVGDGIRTSRNRRKRGGR